MECPSFYPETASTPVDSEGTAKGRQQRRMSCPSVGVRTMSTVRDNKGGSRGMNVEWERAKRGKRPNKPNGYCSITYSPLHLMSQHYALSVPP